MVAPSPNSGVPPYTEMVDENRLPTQVWYQYFLSLFTKTGGGGTIVVSGANFAPASANAIFAGPVSGTATRPDFRPLASADLLSVAGQIPGVANNSAAPIGDVGEYVQDLSASPVAMTSGAPIDIASLLLTAGDWDLWATFGTTPAGGASQTLIKAWISSTSATDPGPFNGGAYLSRTITAGEVGAQIEPVGMMQFSSASGGQVFLSAAVTYAGGTLAGGGFIGARRRR
jgi:hypothetical protein